MLWDGAVGTPCASASRASERIKTNLASCKVRFDGTSLSIAEWSAHTAHSFSDGDSGKYRTYRRREYELSSWVWPCAKSGLRDDFAEAEEGLCRHF